MYEIYIDGGCKPNPGKASCGFVVYKNRQVVYENKYLLGIATNNVAELRAAQIAIQWCVDNKIKSVKMHTDSWLVYIWLGRKFMPKEPRLFQIKKEILAIENQPQMTWVQIPREKNSHADRLCNEALSNGAEIKTFPEFIPEKNLFNL